jgi:serine/threonine-protein phosphatase 4 catalytic subunit
MISWTNFPFFDSSYRCGNVAAILELNENLQRDFTIFEAAPQESRGIPLKKPQADYFL